MTSAELAADIVKWLQKRQWKVATAESCTGGLVARYLTGVPGASDVFDYGIISYANRIKIQELGVSPETLAAFGAVSEQTAREMARGVREKAQSQFGVSTTGIAGPGGGTAEKPVGTVYIAVSDENGETIRRLELGDKGGREEIREAAAEKLLLLLWNRAAEKERT